MKILACNELDEMPFVSVIMPVRNEAAYIERSLRAALAQNYPAKRFEIVIADGMSTDQTRNIIEQIKQSAVVPITVVDNRGQIAPTGLNAAIARATGEIIVRVDGHCEIDADYIVNCVRHLQSGAAAGVGGSIETIGETVCAGAIACAMSSKFGVGGSAFRTVKNREMYVDTVAFPGYSRTILEKVGAFNEELVRNQDDEFNYRIRKAGGKILLAPDVRARYYSRGNLHKLWQQYYQYGFWKVRVMQLHPRQMSVRQFVPFLFVLNLALAGLLAFVSIWGFLYLLALIVAYSCSNLIASLLTAKNGWRYLPFLPACFLILHFSYGIGFAHGLLFFAGNWRTARTQTS